LTPIVNAAWTEGVAGRFTAAGWWPPPRRAVVAQDGALAAVSRAAAGGRQLDAPSSGSRCEPAVGFVGQRNRRPRLGSATFAGLAVWGRGSTARLPFLSWPVIMVLVARGRDAPTFASLAERAPGRPAQRGPVGKTEVVVRALATAFPVHPAVFDAVVNGSRSPVLRLAPRPRTGCGAAERGAATELSTSTRTPPRPSNWWASA